MEALTNTKAGKIDFIMFKLTKTYTAKSTAHKTVEKALNKLSKEELGALGMLIIDCIPTNKKRTEGTNENN